MRDNSGELAQFKFSPIFVLKNKPISFCRIEQNGILFF